VPQQKTRVYIELGKKKKKDDDGGERERGNGMMTMGRNKRVGLINRFPSCRVDGQDVDGRISRLHILDHRNDASIVVYGQGYYVEEKRKRGLAALWIV
jgi:hypothetical protein